MESNNKPISYIYSYRAIPAWKQTKAIRLFNFRAEKSANKLVRFLMKTNETDKFSLEQLSENRAAINLIGTLIGPRNVTIVLEMSIFENGSLLKINAVICKLFVGAHTF